ncbi:MAG: ATP-binding protein [Balneolia bacterium]|nr:ATP-binding protein [Balneolia bacterium]
MKKTQLYYTFESNLEELNRLPDILDQICKTFGLNSETEARLMLTVSEAVTNAIRHGNKENPAKQATMAVARTDQNELEIKVSDEGDGFSLEEVPDPLAEENLLKTSGRGVYLMKEYADKVSYNDKGNKLTLMYKLD